MSAAYESISSARPVREAAVSPAIIAARMDRLPATRTLWRLVALISLGGWFELYDLFFTGYIAPGLARSGLLTNTTQSLFGLSGMGAFIAATFAGLFLGTFFLGFLSDHYGRRFVFTWSLLWYTAASAAMALQSTSDGLLLWRLIAGIGLGVEIVTIDAYIVEMAPGHMRGRAFALNQAVMFSAVPIVAVLAWQLVPISPLGLDGWRWVVLIGAAGAIVVWFIRRSVPESPRWLVQNGRGSEAERIVARLEAKIAGEYGQALPQPAPAGAPAKVVSARIKIASASIAELFRPPYRSRLLMLVVFNLCQVVGYYGFANWVPTLLVA
jgi:MFS transporter, putative metabolite:H+ symporter